MIPIRKRRERSIDYFKGLLVIGMIYTHVMQFFSDETIFPSVFYSNQFFNLITFSGFVFCFGYVSQLAYYRKPFKQVYKRMILNGLKTLVAFYISGVAFCVYVDGLPLNLNTILPIIILEVIPGWSEFLVSFSLFTLLGLVLFNVISWLTDRPTLFWVVCLSLLATTFIDYSAITISQLGLLIGTSMFPTFPVIQYLPYYLIGIYFAKHRIDFHRKYLLASIVGTAIFVCYLFIHEFKHLPERFPPSLYWIIGATFILYIYYIFSKLLDRIGFDLRLLSMIGENVLFYLLLSNILIFSIDHAIGIHLIIGPIKGILLSFVLILVITYLIRIVRVSN